MAVTEWIDRTSKNEPVRIIKLMHLDGNVRQFRDDGCNQDGKPNQQRAHLIAMLRKKTTVPRLDDALNVQGPVLDAEGQPLFVPVFKLAGPPPPFPYSRFPEKVRNKLEAADRSFDREFPMRTGDGYGWNVADDAWRGHSSVWRSWKKKSADEHSVVVAQAQRQEAGEALERLLVEATKRNQKVVPSAPRA